MPPLATTMLSPLNSAKCEPGWACTRADQCARRASTGQIPSVSKPKVQATMRWTATMVACPRRPRTRDMDATATKATNSKVSDAGRPSVLSASAASASAAMTAVTVSQPTRLTQLTTAGPMLPERPKGSRDSTSMGKPARLPATPSTPTRRNESADPTMATTVPCQRSSPSEAIMAP